MSLISGYIDRVGQKQSPSVDLLRQTFAELAELAEKEPQPDPELYAFAMYIQKQPWFKDPEIIQAISDEDPDHPGHWTMPRVFCEAMDVVKREHNKLAVQAFPKLPMVRQNYVTCISQYIQDHKKTGRLIRVRYTDGERYPDEMTGIPDGWLGQEDQVMVETEVVLTAFRGGTLTFVHDSPIKGAKRVCAFFFSKSTQYSLTEDEITEQGLAKKGEIPYKAIV